MVVRCSFAYFIDLVHRFLAGVEPKTGRNGARCRCNGSSAAPEMARAQKRTLDNADINPELSARWLRNAHAIRVLNIFRAVSKGVFAGLPRQRRRAAHAISQTLTILAGWRTEIGCHTFVTLVVAHRISAELREGKRIVGGCFLQELELKVDLSKSDMDRLAGSASARPQRRNARPFTSTLPSMTCTPPAYRFGCAARMAAGCRP